MLPPGDRSLVEQLFSERALRALICTSTLAMGVNLPAHLVIVKSTLQYQGAQKGYVEMPSSSVLQMIGRAGRPGLDDHGIAVIMTKNTEVNRYKSLAQGQDIVESSLHDHLVTFLNSEICNSVITNVQDALEWWAPHELVPI